MDISAVLRIDYRVYARYIDIHEATATPPHREPTPPDVWGSIKEKTMTYSIVQDALTLAATAVLYTAIAYIAGGILHQIWKTPTPQAIQETPKTKTPTVGEAPKTDPAPTPIPAPIRPAALTIAPSALRVEEDAPKSGTIRELRKRCNRAGIKGAARFTKAQCLAALG